jgi:isopenicillin N synthase-like dioxygenase
MTIRSVPIIDIAPFLSGYTRGQAQGGGEVGRACEEIGFLIVKGHGVPRELVTQMYDVSKRFFDLPLDEKMETHGRERSRGYGPLGEEALSYGLGKAAPADVKEGLYEGPMDVPDTPYFRGPEGAPHFVPNIWPARPPELREVWRAYYGQMERLARDIMRIFAVALELPERFFDAKDRQAREPGARHQLSRPARGAVARPAPRGASTPTTAASPSSRSRTRRAGSRSGPRQGEWLDVEAVPGHLRGQYR